jgi:hypothetical protein
MQDKSMAMVTARTLDDQSKVRFASQIFIDLKPEYYSFADETHNMTAAETLASFSANGDD